MNMPEKPRQKHDPRQAALFAEEPLQITDLGSPKTVLKIDNPHKVVPASDYLVIHSGDKLILRVGQLTPPSGIERVKGKLQAWLPGINIVVIPAEEIFLYRAEDPKAEAVESVHDVSDGHHTFGELYDHRRALTAALCKSHLARSWRSKQHHPDDRPMFEGGYFVVGLTLPQGQISYHYKLAHWDDFEGVDELPHAPKYDGSTPADVITRLLGFARETGEW